jgi:hypothetical protein
MRKKWIDTEIYRDSTGTNMTNIWIELANEKKPWEYPEKMQLGFLGNRNKLDDMLVSPVPWS